MFPLKTGRPNILQNSMIKIDTRSIFRAVALAALFGLAHPSTLAAGDDERGAARVRIEPEGFLYGVGLAVNRQIYRGYDRRVILLPILGYRGEKLLVFGPFVRYALVQSGAVTFSIQAAPRFQGFDEFDSDIFAGMDEREFSMDAGFGLEYASDNFKFELSSLHDVLDRSDGSEIGLGVSQVYRSGSWFIEPALGLSYLNRRHVDYYYGVGADEVAFFRPAYDGDEALNVNLGVSFTTPEFFGGLARIGLEYTRFDDEIADSPLVDEADSLGLIFAYSRFF